MIQTKLVTQYSQAQLYDPVTFQQDFNSRVNAVGVSVANQAQEKVNEIFAPPIGAVKYPIQWKTDKQRRAFFATDGFGRGIPTMRTGKVSKGWKVEYDNGILKLYNRVKYARYVYGGFDRRTENQQPFHRNTGWITGLEGRRLVMEEIYKLIDAEYYEEMRALIAGTGGLF